MRVNIQSRAVADIAAAVDWYEARSPGLGLEFVLELDVAIEKVAESPKIYSIQYRDARRALLRRFPYAVYFLCEGEVIEVFAVLHQRRTSSSWRSRLP